MRRTAILMGLAVLTLLATAISMDAVEVWTGTYGDARDDMAFDVVLLDDGGYLLAGESIIEYEPSMVSRAILLRLDAQGDVVWEKTYGEDRSGSLRSLLTLEEGGFAATGMIQSADGDDSEVFLLRVDADGNELWSESYGTPLDEGANTVRRTSDGGFVLIANSVDPNDIVADPGAAGYAGAAGRANVYLVRTDADGYEIWSRRYESDENTISAGGYVSDDGGIVILRYVLHYPVDDNDIVLFKVDAGGNDVWSHTWVEGKASGYCLAAAQDGGYIISGSRSFPEDPGREKSDALLIKVDAAGHELWSTTYGEPDLVETAHSVLETRDGNIVCIGWQEQDLYRWTDNILLAGFDGEGEPLWQELIRSNAHNLHEGLVEHPDGTLVVAGSASRPSRSFRIQLLKIDISDAGNE
jgi:hypothetical protein